VPRSKCVELCLHSPNTPPWRGAQLKHGDNFTFFSFYLLISLFVCFVTSYFFLFISFLLHPLLLYFHNSYFFLSSLRSCLLFLFPFYVLLCSLLYFLFLFLSFPSFLPSLLPSLPNFSFTSSSFKFFCLSFVLCFISHLIPYIFLSFPSSLLLCLSLYVIQFHESLQSRCLTKACSEMNPQEPHCHIETSLWSTLCLLLDTIQQNVI
jgi:hypothetical protein